MENVNLLNLPPSEKLVAILDGELNQNEAGNFFQELYQSQDLQDQFFDMINIKNNFRATGITPPDNLKSNILKGVGLAAASTITYQTVATNNVMTWGSALVQSLGSKISIAMMSALMASLVTIGVLSYDANNSDINSNQKSELVQNQNNSNNNNQVNGVIAGNVTENTESNSEDQVVTNSKIPVTKSITKQSTNYASNNKKSTKSANKNTNNEVNLEFSENSDKSNIDKLNIDKTNTDKTNSDKNKLLNNSLSSNNIIINEDENSYDKNSLISGTVPESKYKVEIISKNSNSNSTDKNLDNSNLESTPNNNNNITQNATIKPIKTEIDPKSDLDFYNPETTKSMYIDEDSKMSFHFRNFSAKAVNDLDIPQMNNPIINNIGAGILYEMTEKWTVGVEIGQENFEQEFKAQNGDNQIYLQQNHLAFWGGALVRYNFNNSKIKSEFNPYVNMFVGSTDIGPLVKPSIGITYNISNDFSVFGAGEFTAMYSKYNSIWYNTQKYGFTYGFILKF